MIPSGHDSTSDAVRNMKLQIGKTASLLNIEASQYITTNGSSGAFFSDKRLLSSYTENKCPSTGLKNIGILKSAQVTGLQLNYDLNKVVSTWKEGTFAPISHQT